MKTCPPQLKESSYEYTSYVEYLSYVIKKLTTTLRLMEQAVQIDNQEIQAAVHDMIHSGGKLLRPAYQLLFSYFGEQRDPKRRQR